VNISIIKEAMWLWMFGRGLTHRRVKQPDGSFIDQGYKRPDADRVVASIANVVSNDISLTHQWGFAIDEASTSSENGTAQYTLRGKNDDCRSIINLRWGDGNGFVLREYDVLELDRELSSDRDTSDDTGAIFGYTIPKYSTSRFPIVEIFGTPSSVETIPYRYYKKNISIAVLTEHFLGLVLAGIQAKLDAKIAPEYHYLLDKMVDEYSPGGEGYASFRRDPRITAGNIRRSQRDS